MKLKLAKLISEHKTPKHARTRDVHDGLSPLTDIISNVRQQVIEYRKQLTKAQLADLDHSSDGQVEFLYQTLGAMDASAKVIEEEMRKLAGQHAQWDRYMAEVQKDIADGA